ncbi:AAA family ATPase [Chloroflexota bacterium]
MIALYVVSSESAAGKTAICAGICKNLLGADNKVGYFKPLTGEVSAAGDKDGDAAFLEQVLDSPETAASLAPHISDVKKIKEACDKVHQGKDVVLVEGTLGLSPGDSQSKASYEIAKALNARVIVVEAYSSQPSSFIDSYKGFGENLYGIVVNKVPVSQLKRVQDEVSALLGKSGLNVLGVLPEDRVLFSITIGELAESIQGKILNSAEKSIELVENVMLGAMCVDSGLEYFGRKTDKAAVVRDDRPDMQLAALETRTTCLVISGITETPMYSVLDKAENKGIPIILTENNTDTIVTAIEDALGKNRFSQVKKLPRLAEIMQHLDFQAVYRGLNIAS